MEKYLIAGGAVAFYSMVKHIHRKMLPYFVIVVCSAFVALKLPILGIFLWTSTLTHLTNAQDVGILGLAEQVMEWKSP